MSALDEREIMKGACPQCNGDVERWYFDGGCNGGDSSAGFECKSCGRSWTPRAWLDAARGKVAPPHCRRTRRLRNAPYAANGSHTCKKCKCKFVFAAKSDRFCSAKCRIGYKFNAYSRKRSRVVGRVPCPGTNPVKAPLGGGPRRVWCTMYGECLRVADANGWRGFSCAECTYAECEAPPVLPRGDTTRPQTITGHGTRTTWTAT